MTVAAKKENELNVVESEIRKRFWEENTFVILDTETNGLYPEKNNGPCEVAMLKIINGVVQSPKSWFIKPELSIPPHVQAVHHISNEDVANAEPIESLASTFQEFCRGSIIVAHNAPFDKGMMSCLQGDEFKWMDNLRLARHTWQSGTPNDSGHPLTAHKNKVLQHWLELDVDTMGQAAHRAQADILVTAEIFIIGINKFLLTQDNVPTIQKLSTFLDSPYYLETFMGTPLVDIKPNRLLDHLRRNANGEFVLDKDQQFSLEAMHAVKSRSLTPEERILYKKAFEANESQMMSRKTELSSNSFNTMNKR